MKLRVWHVLAAVVGASLLVWFLIYLGIDSALEVLFG